MMTILVFTMTAQR